MARRKDPKKTAEKWRTRLSGATAEIRDGVEAVNEAPGVLAAAAQDKMLAKLTARVEDGTWAARVSAISLPEWQDAMLKKGVPRIASGAEAAIPKVEDFHNQLADHQDKINVELDKMPSVSLQDGIEKSRVQIERMAKFRKK